MQHGKNRTPQNGSDEKSFHELSDHELLDIMKTRARTFLRAHGVHVLFGLAVILLVVVVVQTVLARRKVADMKGHQALANMQPVSQLAATYTQPVPQAVENARLEMITQCRKIVEEYSPSSAVPWARIRMAQLYALAQEWEKAESQYETVIEEQANRTVVNTARAGLAAVREDLGQYESAGQLYAQVAERLPLYLLDAGRCYEMADMLDAARETYARVADADVSESIKETAEDRLEAIERGGRYVYSPPPRVKIEVEQPEPMDTGDILGGPPGAETPIENILPRAETPTQGEQTGETPEEGAAE